MVNSRFQTRFTSFLRQRGNHEADTLSIAFLLVAIPYAFAWGEEGHSIIAEIAQRRLTPQAAQAIVTILRSAGSAADYTTPSLASIST